MRLTRADKALIAGLLVVSLAGIGLNFSALSPGGEQEAQITKNGQLIRVVPLRPGYSQEIRLGGEAGYNVIEVDNGRIRVKDSDCPDRVCVRSGWVAAAPQQVVCLPYRVMIRIHSARPADVDEITR